MKDYYIKQLEFVPKIKELSKKLSFHPEIHRQILDNWLESISIDWPISRRRFYGTEIPIWYCTKCDEPYVPPAGKYYKPWKEDPPFSNCLNCGHQDFIGDERTFDTWMDSSITPLYITKFKQNDNFFSNAYPTCIRPQSKDIVRTWLFYTMLRCYQLTKVLPWSDVWVMGYGVDEKGEKMSKSKGNVIDPLDIIDQGYGADALRTYVLFMGPIELDAPWDSRGIAGIYRFLNRVWTLHQEFLEAEKTVTKNDSVIVRLQHKTTRKVTEDYRRLSFNTAISALMEYVNELYKLKTDGFSDESWREALGVLVRLLAPFAPHMSNELWQQLGYEGLIETAGWPVWDDALVASDTVEIIVQVNGKLRARLQVSTDASEEAIKEAALTSENVVKFVGGKKPAKVIYVPGRLINVVV